MKLLVITQVMDTEHPILGFFHAWVLELSKQCEQVHVICLQEGVHTLPDNVHVHSLGKEAGKGRLVYLMRFFSLIWKLRHQYDNVFVHMNQIYVILGAPFWRAWGKKVGLWYAHGSISLSLKIATILTHIIFTSTPEGFRITTAKRVIVGQGIDTTLFTPGNKLLTDIKRLVTVGRISPSKNIDTLLKACAVLKDKGVLFHFRIVGVATTDSERQYEARMRQLASQLNLEDSIEWTGAVPHRELPPLLQQSDIFIHDGATNSLDKALLEAALCGCIVVSSNPAYRSLTQALAPDLLFVPKDHQALAARILQASTQQIAANTVTAHVAQTYDIATLTSNIINTY